MNKIRNIFTVVSIIIILFYIVFSGNFISSTATIIMDKKIESKIFDKFDNRFYFVFFGYVGCDDVCTPRLQEIVPIHNELIKNGKDLKTVFVNLIYLKDSSLPQLFAKTFSEDFEGIYLEGNELNRIMSEFGVFNVPSLSVKGDYDHTSFLFLVTKEKNIVKLKRIYTNTPFDREKIVKDIMENF